jgi:hypothetical protein
MLIDYYMFVLNFIAHNPVTRAIFIFSSVYTIMYAFGELEELRYQRWAEKNDHQNHNTPI